MIGFEHYLLLSAILFGVGIFGVISKRNAISVLMAVEIMLNAVNINFIAITKFVTTGEVVGQFFALLIIVVAAAEIAIGLALVVAIFRQKKSINLSELNVLRW